MIIVALLFLGISAAEQQYTFIGYGDSGQPLHSLFAGIGYTRYICNDKDEPVFSDAELKALVEYQAANMLAETGCFDIETLHSVLKVSEADYTDDIVWIPMHGGKKYHLRPACSKMIEPRQMPVDCAMILGFTPCQRCY